MYKLNRIINSCRSTPSRTKYSFALASVFMVYLFYLLTSSHRKSSYIVTSHSSEGRSYSLAVRDRTPANYNTTIVLLHSDRLDSTVWENIGTLELLHKKGYRVFAIDLPGYGNSFTHKPPKEDYEKAFIFEMALKELKATDSIIVAPSMSGVYALPVVLRGSLSLRGFVPISPHGCENYQKSEYLRLKLPTLILYGLGDKEYGEKTANILQNIPDNKVYIIKGASHACYLQNPEEFHEVLLNFINEVETRTFDSIQKEQMMKIDSY